MNNDVRKKIGLQHTAYLHEMRRTDLARAQSAHFDPLGLAVAHWDRVIETLPLLTDDARLAIVDYVAGGIGSAVGLAGTGGQHEG